MSASDASATVTVRANGTQDVRRSRLSVPRQVAFLLHERAEGREDIPGEGLADFLRRMAAILSLAAEAHP